MSRWTRGHSRSRSTSGMPSKESPSDMPPLPSELRTREKTPPRQSSFLLPSSFLSSQTKSSASHLGGLQRSPSAGYAMLPAVEGWLVKRGSFVKSWKRRFFKLKDFKLYYYLTPHDQREKGYIDLKLVHGIEPIKDERVAAALGVPGLNFAFDIQTPQRTYILQASSYQEVEYWIKGLGAHLLCVERIQLPRGPISSSSSNIASTHSSHTSPYQSPSSPLVTDDWNTDERISLQEEKLLQSFLANEEKEHQRLTSELVDAQKSHATVQKELRQLMERLGAEEDEEMKLMLLVLKTRRAIGESSLAPSSGSSSVIPPQSPHSSVVNTSSFSFATPSTIPTRHQSHHPLSSSTLSNSTTSHPIPIPNYSALSSHSFLGHSSTQPIAIPHSHVHPHSTHLLDLNPPPSTTSTAPQHGVTQSQSPTYSSYLALMSSAKQSSQLIRITEEMLRLKTEKLKELEASISKLLDLLSFTEVKIEKIKAQQRGLEARLEGSDPKAFSQLLSNLS